MIFAILILLLPANLFGQVFISEVLSNEPGSRVNLEWVEIVNTSDRSADLANFAFVCGADTTNFPDSSWLGAYDFAILARRLTAPGGGDSFEGHWGDSSGYWGDGYRENFDAFQADMSLGNESGSVYLIDIYRAVVDSFVWSSSTRDGVSMERGTQWSPMTGWHECSDRTGSTPGASNTVPWATAIATFDIQPRIISYRSDRNIFEINYSVPNNSLAGIEIFDDTGRKRRDLVTDMSAGWRFVSWDGTDNDSRKLPPGVYIILFSTIGNVSYKQTEAVVISP